MGDDGKSYIDVKIQPTEDKFYILGVVADPRGKRTTTDTTVDGVTTRRSSGTGTNFSSMPDRKKIQRRGLRGDCLNRRAASGVDYLTLNDKLKLTFEASDRVRPQRPPQGGSGV